MADSLDIFAWEIDKWNLFYIITAFKSVKGASLEPFSNTCFPELLYSFCYFAMLPKGMCGSSYIPPQKPINRPGWREGKFAYFRCCKLVDGDRYLFRLTPPQHARGESFNTQIGERFTCRNSASISKSSFESIISGRTSIIMAVLDTANLHSQDPFIPISCSQFSGWWQLMSWYSLIIM